MTAGSRFATAEVSFSGDTAHIPASFFGILSGSEGAWTYTLITGGAGSVSAGTPRVTLASDDPAVVALQILDNAISGNEMQVDVVGALPAGTNAIGKLAANSGVDIGDVDVTSVSGNVTVVQGTASNLNATVVGTGTFVTQVSAISAGDNNIGNVDIVTVPSDPFGVNADAASATGSISAKLRFIASTGIPITGTVAVTQSGSWSVTANAGTNLNTSALALESGGNLAACASSLGTLDNIVSGNEAQVDIVAALPAGTNNIGDVDILSIASGDNNIGNVDIASIAAGNNNIGDVDVASIAAGTNLIGNVGLGVRTSGGMTIFRSIDVDETEEEIKATAGQVYSIAAFNRTAAPLYLKFYNATAANVTVGSTTPVLTFVVPGNADSDGAGFIWDNPIGFAFGTAITVACTTGVADADTGAPGANECIVNVGYA